MWEATTLVEHFPYIGIFILLILGGVGLPFPEDATLILSGFLVGQNVIEPFQTFLVIYAGLLISDYFLYWVGKKYGRMLVLHKRFQKIISSDQVSKLEEKFQRKGIWVIFIGRHFMGLRAQVFLVAGVMRMSAIKFLTTDAMTALLTIALMGGMGYAGGNSAQILRKDLTRIEHIAIVALMISIAVWIVSKYLKGHKKNLGR
jgi:membrane protein DedA with SNARE-associated domain